MAQRLLDDIGVEESEPEKVVKNPKNWKKLKAQNLTSSEKQPKA